jgi:hypothetical protein
MLNSLQLVTYIVSDFEKEGHIALNKGYNFGSKLPNYSSLVPGLLKMPSGV